MPDLPVVNDSQNEAVFCQVLKQVIPTVSRLDNERLVKKIGQERFRDACDELFGFIESGVSTPPLTRLEKDALGCKLIVCLKDYIRENLKIPVTLKTLIDSFSLLDEAIDRSFPGYRESHLLRYLIKC